MSAGFRKSFFGFNCNDVIEYIENTHKKFKAKTDVLTEKTEKLSEELNSANDMYQKLLEEKNSISRRLDEFLKKSDEIERLSENIGKLYLVSQANAQAIISNAEENSSLVDREVNKNISAIDEAHLSLQQLRENIIKTSDDFIKEVDILMNSIDTTRTKITENTLKIETAKNNFKNVFNKISEN